MQSAAGGLMASGAQQPPSLSDETVSVPDNGWRMPSRSLCCELLNTLLCTVLPGCVDGNGRAYLWGPNLRDPVTRVAGGADQPQVVPGMQHYHLIRQPLLLCMKCSLKLCVCGMKQACTAWCSWR